jgi:hypothetical protein
LLVDWEAVARASLAMFRADCARYAGDPNFERFVARLTRLSPEFAQWWPQREVARPLAGQKRIDHPTAGRTLFEYSSFGVGDPPDMKLIAFTPGSCATAPSDPSLTPRRSVSADQSIPPERPMPGFQPRLPPNIVRFCGAVAVSSRTTVVAFVSRHRRPTF